MELPFTLTWTNLIASAIVLSLSVFAMGLFTRKNHFEVAGKTILLTGASEGMGKCVAEMLAKKGANIVIVARNVSKLEAALKDIQAAAVNPTTQKFHYISADVSKEGEATRIVSEVTAWNNNAAPDIVWCMAGAARPGLFLETTPRICRQQMDINYWSCADMAHAILSIWCSPSTGDQAAPKHLIFTSSVVAFYTIAGYSPYAPAKTAIRALSDTLSQEMLLYPYPIRIHTVFPGTISSPGLLREDETKPEITRILEKDDPVQTPEQVAAKSIRGLENGEYLVTVGLLGQAMRGCMWGGVRRNNWIWDTLMTWVASILWVVLQPVLDGTVKKHGKENGHPGTAKP